MERYVWQKFYEAVNSLVGSRPIKERLSYAFQALILLLHSEIPKDVEKDYVEMMRQFTSYKAEGEEGDVHATLNKMNDLECEDLARKIVSIYDNVTRRMKPHY